MNREELEQVERALRDAPLYAILTEAQAAALTAAYGIIRLAKAQVGESSMSFAHTVAEERAAAAEALLAEACEILEFYVLLGSRKAKDFLAKVKHQEETNA